ncbi:MAG: hypothetical protein R3C12_02095 [Planctomycetaceae bacterium]|nr:hypothetical protein [Planctomycetaceae bacterium]
MFRPIMPWSVCVLACLILGIGGVGDLRGDDQKKGDSPGPAAPLEPREQAFSERMANTVLVGHFTLMDEPENQGGKPERYEISQINKLNGNMWVFQTRVKYGKVDTVMPIPVPIEWAGDTPVVSMTNFTIPGMGTFSCRVLFDKDRYAGTWQHGEKGGHMWGRIEKARQE